MATFLPKLGPRLAIDFYRDLEKLLITLKEMLPLFYNQGHLYGGRVTNCKLWVVCTWLLLLLILSKRSFDPINCFPCVLVRWPWLFD